MFSPLPIQTKARLTGGGGGDGGGGGGGGDGSGVPRRSESPSRASSRRSLLAPLRTAPPPPPSSSSPLRLVSAAATMARARAFFLILLATAAIGSASAGILDLLWGSDDSAAADQRGEGPAEATPLSRNCTCAGAACHCCAALDFAYIDLGGPGCVSMRYVSPTEGIALNVSYGESLLLSDAVKGAKPPPACVDLLSDLAQLCARVGQLAPTADGLRWCLSLEPVLLGEPQVSYPLGCFRMGPEGMRMDPPPPPAAPSPSPAPDASVPESEQESVTTENPSEQLSEEELIAVVNQSAEEGIAFFSNLLGLTFGGAEGGDNSTEAATNEDNATPLPSVETSAPSSE